MLKHGQHIEHPHVTTNMFSYLWWASLLSGILELALRILTSHTAPCPLFIHQLSQWTLPSRSSPPPPVQRRIRGRVSLPEECGNTASGLWEGAHSDTMFIWSMFICEWSCWIWISQLHFCCNTAVTQPPLVANHRTLTNHWLHMEF